MTKYSIAIRTLALNPEILRQELESIKNQSVKAEKVVIYIAKGYAVPDFRICGEKYVETQKGMFSQRAVEYEEIDTPLIMLLDDDVVLSKDCAKNMIKALTQKDYDCLGADVFEIHKLPLRSKIFAAFSNLILPHTDTRFAIKIKDNGSFSYLNNPKEQVIDSQSAAGPCSLWYKDALLNINIQEEKWIDQMGFPFNEDTLLFHKLYRNGGKLGFMYDSGVTHLDCRTASGSYHNDKYKFLIRSKVQYILWYRMIYHPANLIMKRIGCTLKFLFKSLWMIPVHFCASIRYRNMKIPGLFIKGLYKGILYTHSSEYRTLEPYVFTKY